LDCRFSELQFCQETPFFALYLATLSLLGLKTFHREPGEASWLTLELTLVTVFLLALPVVWHFMLNGIMATWTLPDQASMFLAFISILQILVVSISGLVLIGLSALISRYTNL